jgi:signal transduction histidine kinase
MASTPPSQGSSSTAVSSETIEQVLALLSHELRTPMTSLQGAIELLQSHSLQDSEEIEALLRLAANNSDRLSRLIEAILTWSQLTYHESPLFKQHCNGAQLLQAVVAELVPLAATRQIEIQQATTQPLPLLGDRQFLHRALLYVVHNAIKFSPSGSLIRLSTTVVTSTEAPVVSQCPLALPFGLITVEDQGIGIPAGFIEKIFLPFSQVDSSDRRSHQGLGLELAICRQIVQQHGGHIWAESHVGQGSTFYIALPLAD